MTSGLGCKQVVIYRNKIPQPLDSLLSESLEFGSLFCVLVSNPFNSTLHEKCQLEPHVGRVQVNSAESLFTDFLIAQVCVRVENSRLTDRVSLY